MLQILDEKLLEEIRGMIKSWLYYEESHEQLMYRIEQLVQNKSVQAVLRNKERVVKFKNEKVPPQTEVEISAT